MHELNGTRYRDGLDTVTLEQKQLKQRVEQDIKSVSAADYDKFVLSRRRDVFAQQCAETLASITLGEKCRILEVGAGTGIATRAFRTINGAEVFALDLNQKYLKYAVVLGRSCVERTFAGDFEDIPFPDSYFDVYTGTAILNHRTDTSRFYSEAFRVIKPGGIIFLPWVKPKPGSIDREIQNLQEFPTQSLTNSDWYILAQKPVTATPDMLQ